MWTPDPIAFYIGSIGVRWYGILIAAAVALGCALGAHEQKRLGLPRDTMLDMYFYMLPLAIICARIYYVAFEWPRFRDDLLSVLYIHHGGLAIYGGVIGGFIGIWLYSRRHRARLAPLLDMVTPALPLGQAIGRWGNFFNQEAYGGPIESEALRFFPVGVYIEALGEWRYAAFFYESMWCLLVFVILMVTRKRMKRPGDVLLWYLLLYGMERAVVEGLRSDSLYLGGIRFSQIVSIALIAIAAAVFFARIAHRRAADGIALGCVALGCAALLWASTGIAFAALTGATGASLAGAGAYALYRNTAPQPS